MTSIYLALERLYLVMNSEVIYEIVPLFADVIAILELAN
jgi:hypothetical protein